jgi:hypothetical protein
MKPPNLLITLSAIALASAVSVFGQTRIIAQPVSPRDVSNYAELAGVPVSSGLMAVAIGENIYLEAQVDSDVNVTGDVVWELTSVPGGSNAILDTSPVPLSVPSYSLRHRSTHQVAGRTLLVPDVVGKYTIKATIPTDGGNLEATATASGSTYAGVGDQVGGKAVTPQCGTCHVLDDRVEPYFETGHASALTNHMTGNGSDHFGSQCLSCHVLGPESVGANGGWADLAAQHNWTWPVDGSGHQILSQQTWDDLPDDMKNLGNIQCESCHGAGADHSGDPDAIDVSYDVGLCARCHDSGAYHVRTTEWKSSPHATNYVRESGSCVRCHTASGFVAFARGQEARGDVVEESIVCAACHDPHSKANEHQVRTVADVTLFNGDVVEDGDLGKVCMQCHISRRDAEDYVLENHGHYGPHHGPQTDMIAGSNAVQFGKYIPSSTGHLLATEKSCATCHMQALSSDNPAKTAGISGAGSHTFRMVWNGDTPDDPSDDVHQTGVCAECHGPTDTFDIMTRKDFDGDGVAEGIQTEIHDLLHELAMLLPPYDQPTVDDPTDDYTQAQRSAVYNYLFVEEDGSLGVHNPQYAAGVLNASIAALTADDALDNAVGGTTVGGGWNLSGWLGYYSLIFDGNWIFHQYHGPLYLAPSTGSNDLVQLYDPVIGDWLLTSPERYPLVTFASDFVEREFTQGAGGQRIFTDAEGNVLTYPGFTFEPPELDTP